MDAIFWAGDWWFVFYNFRRLSSCGSKLSCFLEGNIGIVLYLQYWWVNGIVLTLYENKLVESLRFQVLVVASVKMIAFQDIVSVHGAMWCDEFISLMMDAVHTTETSVYFVTTQRCTQEGYHLSCGIFVSFGCGGCGANSCQKYSGNIITIYCGFLLFNNNVRSSIRNIGCLQIFSSLLGSWR
jgi:hypothetical protein